jgi:hypothetical protein
VSGVGLVGHEAVDVVPAREEAVEDVILVEQGQWA